MGKGKLGLPLEYKKLPEYFDALNINDGTDGATNAYAIEIPIFAGFYFFGSSQYPLLTI